MEEQDKQVKTDDVEAHINRGHRLQDEDAPTDEHGKRSLSEDDDDVEAHINRGHRRGAGHQFGEDDEPTDEHGKRS